MTTAIPVEHPVVRGMAEKMAREAYAFMCAADPAKRDGIPYQAWEERDSALQRLDIDSNALLLCNLSRPASRDAWARWITVHDIAVIERGAKTWSESDHLLLVNSIRRDWNDRRNNIPALTAAILAALESE